MSLATEGNSEVVAYLLEIAQPDVRSTVRAKVTIEDHLLKCTPVSVCKHVGRLVAQDPFQASACLDCLTIRVEEAHRRTSGTESSRPSSRI
jgi:CRISPR/Cas system-associated protein Csm6